MKSLKILSTIIAMAVTMMFGVGSALASTSTHYQYVEMGDGHYMRFTAHPKEFGRQDMVSTRAATTNLPGKNVAHQWVDRIEMGDGHYATFPMTKAQINVAKQQQAKYNAQQARMDKVQVQQMKKDHDQIVNIGNGRKLVFGKEKLGTNEGIDPQNCIDLNNC